MQVQAGYAILQPVVVALGLLAVLLVWGFLVAALYVQKVQLPSQIVIIIVSYKMINHL